MNLWQNAKTVLKEPEIAGEYLAYQLNRILHRGRTARLFDGKVKIGGFGSFSEHRGTAHYLEPAEHAFLTTSSFPPGDFVDVGANLGVISLVLATRNPNRVIHAFEPNEPTFRALISNIELNHCLNVHAIQSAVGDQVGTVIFNADPIRRATAGLSCAGDPYAVRVACTTLDSYLESVHRSQISLLKVDVEGAETLVFRGARSLLSQRRVAVIYYEVCPKLALRMGFEPAEATSLLRDHGYSIFSLNRYGVLEPADSAAIASVEVANWVALRSPDACGLREHEA